MKNRIEASRKHLDVARKVKRGIELCVHHCEDHGDAYWADLLSNARTGDVRSLRQMVERVYVWQPPPWTLADENAAHLAWTVLEFLEAAGLEICTPLADAA